MFNLDSAVTTALDFFNLRQQADIAKKQAKAEESTARATLASAQSWQRVALIGGVVLLVGLGLLLLLRRK